ncbi:MAG: hypothetical protein NW214_10820 [Pseudanabaenaceae cyanobacterium bins.39]|nr:hypothetical protein [Pseudanabaenaceae cyanobacterium bins.39]
MSAYPPHLISEAFELGNYATVALHGSQDDWQTYAALGLMGKTQAAIAGLSQFNSSDAHFYSAVAYWIGGDDQQAIQRLKAIDTDHAQNLLRLISKPQISVLAQIPWTRVGSQDWLTSANQNVRFCLQNISFHPDDLPNQPYADIHSFYDPQEPPDFYICQMVEWHLIPPNLQQLPCPIFGQTADYDLHLQVVYPWLQLFDELLVTDQSEWQDVHSLVNVPVSTFPKSFCLPATFPDLTQQERPFDMFLSGTVTHPYHPDKAKLLHQVLGIPNLKLKIVNGFDSPNSYYDNLASSKMSFTYVRHPFALPTRGLEALAMGCAIAVQKNSVLTLFVGEDEGVLTYEYDLDNLNDVLQKIIQQWSVFEPRARKGAEIIRQEFAATTVASQYLRYLTFLAAKPRNPRLEKMTDSLVQKRSILQKGWLPSYDFWQSQILQKIREENTLHLQQQMDRGVSSPAIYLDLAREFVLAEYHRSLAQLTPSGEWLSFVIATYKAGIEKFPDSLVLRFNLIRVALHFEKPAIVSESLGLLAETIKQPLSYWKIDTLDDVFPWDFCPTFFNYRQYFDLLTEQKTKGKSVDHLLGQLIIASLYYYLGHYSQDEHHFEKACKLDPHFPHYKLAYARQILRESPSKSSEKIKKAVELLLELTNSTLFLEASEMLEKLHFDDHTFDQVAREFLPRIKQFKKQVKSVENFPEVSLKPDLIQFKELQNQLLIRPALELTTSSLIRAKYTLSSFLSVTEADFRPYVYHSHSTPEVLLTRIRQMESSKFWQLRTLWFRGKWLIRQSLKTIFGRK